MRRIPTSKNLTFASNQSKAHPIASIRAKLRSAFLALAACCALCALPVAAQLPASRLTTLFPPGARAGTTNEVAVSGESLDDPTGLVFSDPRIVAQPKPGSAGVFSVIIPAEVGPEFVDVRFAGRFGTSNPRTFAIGDSPELIAPSSNLSISNAFDVPLDAVVNVRVAANSDHWFRFSAKAGQRLMITAQALELESRLEPVLAVTSPDHRELDHARRGFLDFTAPSNGAFLVQIHDETYRGGDEYACRLSIATTPHLDFALPGALVPGATNHVTLYGRNLPGGQRSPFLGNDSKPLDRFDVEIVGPAWGQPGVPPAELFRRPASLALDSFGWRFASTNGVSNPLLFIISREPVFSSATSDVVRVTLPCLFSGVFPRGNAEASGVRFNAKKGDMLSVEIFSDRLGFPAAPYALFQRIFKNDKGDDQPRDIEEIRDTDKSIGDRDFNSASRDPVSRVQVKEYGEYRIVVRNSFNIGPPGSHQAFLLKAGPETPDFRLISLPAVPPKTKDDDRQLHVATTFLRRGETKPVRVFALRQSKFDGEIELTATHLPAGVRASKTMIASGQNSGLLLLTAEENAIPTNAPFDILGAAKVGTNQLERTAAAATTVWPVADYNDEASFTRAARSSSISIGGAEMAPVTVISASGGPLEAPVGGKVSIPIKLIRRFEFANSLKLKPAGHPAVEKMKETEIDAKATNATVEIDLNEYKLPEGSHTLWLQGQTTVKYRGYLDALSAADGELQQAVKVCDAAAPADKKAAEERKKTAEERKKAAEERAKPRDISLMIYSEPFVLTVRPAAKTQGKT
jgi:hypothetical protein